MNGWIFTQDYKIEIYPEFSKNLTILMKKGDTIKKLIWYVSVYEETIEIEIPIKVVKQIETNTFNRNLELEI